MNSDRLKACRERENALHEIRLTIEKGHGLGPAYAKLLLSELDRRAPSPEAAAQCQNCGQEKGRHEAGTFFCAVSYLPPSSRYVASESAKESAARVERLEAVAKAMERGLWRSNGTNYNGAAHRFCVLCLSADIHGHTKDCPGFAALAALAEGEAKKT